MRKRKPDAPRATSAVDPAAHADRLRSWLLGGAVALWVCRPLWASEGAVHFGDGAAVVMLWIALLVVWLLGAIGRPGLAIRFGWTDAAVLLLVVLYSISAGIGAARANPRPAVNLLWEWVGLGLGFFCARQWIADRREARAVMAAMIGLALTLSLYGLYQRYYEMPQTRATYAADPDATLRSAGIWYAPGSPQRQLFENRLRSDEPLATFALTNSLAGLLAAWLIVVLGIVFWSQAKNRRTALAAGAIAVPIGLCLLLTKSRSAYVAVFAGLMVLGLFHWGHLLRGRRALIALVTLIVAAGAAIFAANMLDRDLLGEASKSLGYRLQYWQASWRMIGDHPVAGCGPGNFQDDYTRYKLPEASEEIADPHNFFLEVWATAGTPAALALLAVLVGAACRAARSAGSAGSACPARQAGPTAALAGALAAYPLAALVSIASPSPPGYGLLLFGAAIAAGTFWALADWIESGQLPAALPAIAAAVLLIHLLASGGISYAGVSGTGWLLTAVFLNLTERHRAPYVSRPALIGLLIIGLALAIGCQVTAYGPVLRGQAAMLRAERAPAGSAEAAEAAEQYQQAIAADPWATAPLERLADVEFRAWLDSARAEHFRQFEWYRNRAMALMPRSSAAWQTTGDYYMRAYRRSNRPLDGQKAAGAFTRAADLYPASALCRAKLAIALAETGDPAGFRREAAKALELDRRTPHADKKLPDALRNSLLRPEKPKQ